MKLKIFTKIDCPNCPAAKELGKKLQKEGTVVEWFDLDEEEGLSEAVFFDVLSTPALIITNDNDCEINGWRGEVPSITDIQKNMSNK